MCVFKKKTLSCVNGPEFASREQRMWGHGGGTGSGVNYGSPRLALLTLPTGSLDWVDFADLTGGGCDAGTQGSLPPPN